MKRAKQYLIIIPIIVIFLAGLFFRTYKINFGLPYNFVADETDIYDAVIKFSLNYKFMIPNGNLQDFAPNSYVYGMFPTYFLTFCTMVLNKLISIFKFSIDFNFYHIYIRIITAVFSFLTALFSYLIFKNIFNNKKGSILCLFLTALNWRLIVYSRYLNQDTYLLTLFIISLYFLILYLKNEERKKKRLLLLLSSIVFGLAVGTKITALISLPVIFTFFLLKKDFQNLIIYLLGIFLSFSISNPFSIINFRSFLSRVVSMKSREAGVVFSSVDQNPLKYMMSFSESLTLPVFLISLLGMFFIVRIVAKNKERKKMNNNFLYHFLLIGNIFTYTIFFSLNFRLVDRWVLPVIPILCIYSAHGVIQLSSLFKNKKAGTTMFCILSILFLTLYSTDLFSLVRQINIGDTRVSAYLWVREYLKNNGDSNLKVLVYTNKGRDPFIAIDNCDVQMFQVYESNNAYNYLPKNPGNYDLIILYSGMKSNYRNNYVSKMYSEYSNSWISFEKEMENGSSFKLIKSFNTNDPDLIGVSDILIYENTQ